MEEILKDITKWKSIWKDDILYDITCYMAFWKRQIYGDSKKINGCQKTEWREGWKGKVQRIFRPVKVILYHTTTLDAYHYAFFQTYRMYNTKDES